MHKMMNIRKWQFIGFTSLGLFYFFVYRSYLCPKKVTNSVLYHNAVNYVKANNQVRENLGSSLLVMNCNGKRYPMMSKCQFDLTVFGEKDKGRIDVVAEYRKGTREWSIQQMKLKSVGQEAINIY